MTGLPHLLLQILAVFMLQAEGQKTPNVSLSPKLDQIYSGDLFNLRCDDGTSVGTVTWYFNEAKEDAQTTKTWKIALALPHHSGFYRCESNGKKSDSVKVEVLDYLPSASLIIETGQPVIMRGGSVILKLSYERGLDGWTCRVYEQDETSLLMLKKNNANSLAFQTQGLQYAETIYWCCADNKTRSNQVRIRTSENLVALEMYPLPAIVGESLTLRCLVWGTDQIFQTVLYKEGVVIHRSKEPTYVIRNVTESSMGSYKCKSEFRNMGQTTTSRHTMESENQDVLVQGLPIRAALTSGMGMTCFCELCQSECSYHWYSQDDNDEWTYLESNQGFMMPKESGTYACKAVWNGGKSYMSRSHVYQTQVPTLLIVLVIGLLILGVGVIAIAYFRYNKRTRAQIYEEVGMMSHDKGENKYEMLQKRHGAKREAEYDTLHSEAAGTQKKEGDYEKLKTEEMQEGEYQTVHMGEATGGEGGYQALKKEGIEEGLYHTVQMTGATGGDGGYEALKKEGMKEGLYHTLSTEGAGGGEGRQEASGQES